MQSLPEEDLNFFGALGRPIASSKGLCSKGLGGGGKEILTQTLRNTYLYCGAIESSH